MIRNMSLITTVRCQIPRAENVEHTPFTEHRYLAETLTQTIIPVYKLKVLHILYTSPRPGGYGK